MDSELLIPLFWMLVFGALITFGVRRVTKKLPTEKRWVRPEIDESESEAEKN